MGAPATVVGGAAGRRRRAVPLLLPLLAALLLASTAHAVLFTLRCGGRAKCVTQDLRGPAVSVARYRVADGVAPQEHKIRVRVRDPKGKSIRLAVESMESGDDQFAFMARKTGRYSACFWSPRSNSSASISINFEWSTGGNATHSWHFSIARKMQAQMPGTDASKQPFLGPNAPANNVGLPKAFESAEDNKQSAASGAAEGEADDDDDNEDGGGKGDQD